MVEREIRSEADQLLLAFLVHDFEVELSGRLLVEECAFLRVPATYVHVAAGNGDVGADTDRRSLPFWGL